MHVDKQLTGWTLGYVALAVLVAALAGHTQKPTHATLSKPVPLWQLARVIDGDTLVLSLFRTNLITIRLKDIDAPERGQPYYRESRDYVLRCVSTGHISAVTNGLDRYKRTLATIYVDGTNINRRLVEVGLAWDYKRWNDDPEISRLEELARERGLGLWQDPQPVAPWDYRHRVLKSQPLSNFP